MGKDNWTCGYQETALIGILVHIRLHKWIIRTCTIEYAGTGKATLIGILVLTVHEWVMVWTIGVYEWVRTWTIGHVGTEKTTLIVILVLTMLTVCMVYEDMHHWTIGYRENYTIGILVLTVYKWCMNG